MRLLLVGTQLSRTSLYPSPACWVPYIHAFLVNYWWPCRQRRDTQRTQSWERAVWGAMPCEPLEGEDLGEV